MKLINDIGVFPRNELFPDPFLLLDVHGSHFDLPLLEYVNEPKHRWWTFVGAPYGTHL
jgi:hypothetical protein